jgi:hypothetical protein
VPAYDLTYSRPAPVAEITVIHPVTAVTRAVLRGKLDTGADLTVIPNQVVLRLGLTPHRQVWARGYDGLYSQRGVVAADFGSCPCAPLC